MTEEEINQLYIALALLPLAKYINEKIYLHKFSPYSSYGKD